MMNKKMILAVVVALLVIGAAWWFLNDSRVRIITKDVNYEATFGMTYVDGSTVEIKRYRTASLVYHEGELVTHIIFNLDAKFKAAQGDDVRLLSSRAGGNYETMLTFYVGNPIFGDEIISEYPLSADTNTDYSVLDTGDWYHVFVNKKVTTKEISDARGDTWFTDSFSLKAVVDIWYNLDPETAEIIHHKLTFTVPFRIMDIISDDDLDDGDGNGGGGEDPDDPDYGKLDPYNPATSPIWAEPIAKPDIEISDPIFILGYASWLSTTDDQSKYKNLGTR